MGESAVILDVHSEAALGKRAAAIARSWLEAGHRSLLIGLQGDLGSGKTTWVRAMLRGLGYQGRVPSPTYTLLEHYSVGPLNVIHMDLYRLEGPDELENVGVRDWLGAADTWLLVEWPERAAMLEAGCDLLIRLTFLDERSRRITISARSEPGNRALQSYIDADSNYSS